MAIAMQIDKEAFNGWAKERPLVIQKLIKKLPPDRLYKMKSTGSRVTLQSYSEDGTVTVAVTGEYNLVAFNRAVFGIKPENLEECDLPSPGEELGTIYTDPEDVNNFIESTR